jgi:hypothetical protein
LLGKGSTGGVAVGEGAKGVSSGSSKTNSYSVMKSEKTGAGIFRVGEKTIPTVVSNVGKNRVHHSESSFYFPGRVLRFV